MSNFSFLFVLKNTHIHMHTHMHTPLPPTPPPYPPPPQHTHTHTQFECPLVIGRLIFLENYRRVGGSRFSCKDGGNPYRGSCLQKSRGVSTAFIMYGFSSDNALFSASLSFRMFQDSFHARRNSHYEAWSYNKKKLQLKGACQFQHFKSREFQSLTVQEKKLVTQTSL